MPKIKSVRTIRSAVWADKLLDAIYMLAFLGATEDQMASALGVSTPTIKMWKRTHIAVRKAWDDGTLGLIAGLAQSLAKRGLGYDYEEEVVTFDRSSHQWVKTKKMTHVPPDSWAAARILELKGRNFNWSVTQQVQINNVNTNIDINYNELSTEQLQVLREISQKRLNAGDSNI